MEVPFSKVGKASSFIAAGEADSKKCGVVSGMGLKNLSARYKLLCNQDIVIENESDKFTVKIHEEFQKVFKEKKDKNNPAFHSSNRNLLCGSVHFYE